MNREIDPSYADDDVVRLLRQEVEEVARDIVRPAEKELDAFEEVAG